MADSVEERIIQNVVEVLRSITKANGYSLDVQRVYRMDENVLNAIERPAIVVLHQGVKEHYGSIDQVECRLALTLWLGMNRDDGWQSAMTRWAADVKKALRLDCGRGNAGGSANAFDTHIVGHDTANTVDGYPIAIVEIDIEVQYRHAFGDDTQQN